MSFKVELFATTLYVGGATCLSPNFDRRSASEIGPFIAGIGMNASSTVSAEPLPSSPVRTGRTPSLTSQRSVDASPLVVGKQARSNSRVGDDVKYKTYLVQGNLELESVL